MRSESSTAVKMCNVPSWVAVESFRWLPTFRRNVTMNGTLMMEPICSSEVLVTTYDTRQHHNPEDHNLYLQSLTSYSQFIYKKCIKLTHDVEQWHCLSRSGHQAACFLLQISDLISMKSGRFTLGRSRSVWETDDKQVRKWTTTAILMLSLCCCL
jgi:hypothetical protein